MVEAARAGGAVALEHYRRGFSVTLKADRSPVTEADREAERAIVDVLRQRYPDHGSLGEEHGEEGPRERRFIVDPIDGTRNFIRRIPTWGVLIGLEEAGQVTAGVVYQPVTGVLHTAWRGQGRGATASASACRPSTRSTARSSSTRRSTSCARAGTGTASCAWPIAPRCSAASATSRPISGWPRARARSRFSTTVKAWDVAALKVLVEEAGGRLTDLDGGDGIYGTTVFASNGLLHDAALAAMHDGRPHPEG